MKRITGWKVYAEKGSELIAEKFDTLNEAKAYYSAVKAKYMKAVIEEAAW